jgi:Cu/Ag efflux protein CusF
MTRPGLLFGCCAIILLAGCGAKKEAAKRYPIQGVVKALDAAAKTATIQHGRIGDWMEAMTMEYPVSPDADFQKLHVGDRIDGTVVVAEVKYYVTDVKVAPAPAQPAAP